MGIEGRPPFDRDDFNKMFGSDATDVGKHLDAVATQHDLVQKIAERMGDLAAYTIGQPIWREGRSKTRKELLGHIFHINYGKENERYYMAVISPKEDPHILVLQQSQNPETPVVQSSRKAVRVGKEKSVTEVLATDLELKVVFDSVDEQQINELNQVMEQVDTDLVNQLAAAMQDETEYKKRQRELKDKEQGHPDAE